METTLADALHASADVWLIYDRHDRLAFMSKNIARLTTHVEDFKIGDTYETINRQRFRRGIYASLGLTEDEFISEQLARRRSPEGQNFTYRATTGRWYLVRSRHTANGGIVNILTDVTELKSAEERAKRAESWLRNAINSGAEVWTVWDRDDRLLICTDSVGLHTSYPEDFQIGVRYEDFLRKRIYRGTVTSAVGREEDYIRETLAARRSQEGQNTVYQRPDGRWFMIRSRRMDDGHTVHIYSEITDLKRAEERATRVETWLRDAITAGGETWSIWDPNDRLVLTTAAGGQFSSYPEDFAIGVDYETFLRQRVARGLVPFAVGREEAYVQEQLAARRTQQGQNVAYRRADGRWTLIRSRRMSDGYTVHIYSDITDLKQAEERANLAERRAVEAEAMLSDAISASTDHWFIYDRNHRLTYHSENLVQQSPYPESHEIGTSYEELLRERFRNGKFEGMPDNEDEFVRQQLSQRNSPSGQTMTYRRSDGGWELVRTRPMANGGMVNIYTDISELKAAEHRAHMAEAMLNEVVRATNDVWSIWDEDERLIMHTAGPGAAPLMPDVFQVGTTVETLMRRQVENGVIVEARGREEEYVQEWLADRRKSDGMTRVFHTPDGRRFLYRNRLTRSGGAVAVLSDISVLKEAEERSARAELRLRNAVDRIADGFRLWDAQDRLVLYNRSFKQQSNTPEATEIGITYEATLRAAVARGSIASARGREELYIQERLDWHRRADGRPYQMRRTDGRWFEVREYRTDEGGTVYLRADITERKQREQELSSARDAAEQASRAKSEFLSRMSHDLRTPLNAVLGFSQLLLMERGREALTRQQHEAVTTIERTGRHLLGLVEDILDLSRIENRALELATEPLSLVALCSEVLTLVQPLAEKRGVTIRHDLIRPTSPQVLGDHKRVIQVLTNLVSNAIKYGGTGGNVVIGAERQDDGLVHISVTDFGPGIPTELHGQLFQPFNRIGQEGATEGTGIGLTIAKGLVERMGGTIGFKSTPGEGTTFWFTLPAAAAPVLPVDSPAEDGAQIVQVRSLGQVGPATVLYVEDTPENRTLVRRLLGRFANIRYLEAETGEVGLEVARRELPDIVLMDMRLPGISGIEALRVLRSDPLTRSMTVIGLTGAAMPHEAAEIRQAGFDGYITKPFRIGVLLDTLTKALDRKTRAVG